MKAGARKRAKLRAAAENRGRLRESAPECGKTRRGAQPWTGVDGRVRPDPGLRRRVCGGIRWGEAEVAQLV